MGELGSDSFVVTIDGRSVTNSDWYSGDNPILPQEYYYDSEEKVIRIEVDYDYLSDDDLYDYGYIRIIIICICM